MNWRKAMSLHHINPGEVRHLRIGQEDVALVRTASGTVWALPNRCPHRGGPLAEGLLCGDFLFCPLHEWKIHVPDGTVAAPDCGSVDPIPVRIEHGHIWIGEVPPQNFSKGLASGG